MPSRGATPVAILITHHHEDHVGGAAFLSHELELPLWAHEETRARVSEGVRITRIVRDGETLLGSWRVLHTPGHAPGHVCLHDEATNALICGDMVASVGTILIAPGDGDMRVYLEQLRRLEVLGARIALPAHGEPIAEPEKVFRRYITHRLMREERVVAALRPAPRPLAEILPDAYADTPTYLWPIAALSLQAHLDKLVAEGRVTPSGENVYRLAT
jgi:glyoxylase-like metal-dependent hydrolase (beta-lactamase superfamily II)